MISSSFSLINQPIRNLLINPSLNNAYYWNTQNGTGTIVSDAMFAGGVAWSGTAPTSTTQFWIQPSCAMPATSRPAVSPGQQYTFSADSRIASPTMAPLEVHLVFIDSGGSTVSELIGPSFTPTDNTVHRIVFSSTAPAGAAYVWAQIRIPSGSIPNDIDLRVSRVMLVQGPDPGYYADGDTPGWQWTGSPGSSESVGYPYTLESIAGLPEVWLDALNPNGIGQALPAEGSVLAAWKDLSGNGHDFTQTTTSSQPVWSSSGPYGVPTVVFDGTDDFMQTTGLPVSSRTVYAVAYTSIGPAAVAAQWIWEATQSQRMHFSNSSGGSLNISGHSDTTDWVNLNNPYTSSNTPCVFVGTYQIESPPVVGSWIDGGSNVTAAVATGTTFYHLVPNTWKIGSRDGGTADFLNGGIQAVVAYPAAHDSETIKRITAWLARQYHTTVSSGY